VRQHREHAFHRAHPQVVEALLPIGCGHSLERACRWTTGVGHQYVHRPAERLRSSCHQCLRIARRGYVAGNADSADLGRRRSDAIGVAGNDRDSDAFRDQLARHGFAEPFGCAEHEGITAGYFQIHDQRLRW
jgi:hypothetical protein